MRRQIRSRLLSPTLQRSQRPARLQQSPQSASTCHHAVTQVTRVLTVLLECRPHLCQLILLLATVVWVPCLTGLAVRLPLYSTSGSLRGIVVISVAARSRTDCYRARVRHSP